MAGVMVPLYIYPGTEWDKLISAKAAHPQVPVGAIINVNSGPGTAYSSTWGTYINKLLAAGIQCFAYVWCGEINEFDSNRDCTRDAANWKAWYPGITGAFIDGFHGGYSATGDLQVQRARAAGFAPVCGNPGMDIAESQLTGVDLACVYESAGQPSVAVMQALAAKHGASKNYFLAYSVPTLDSTLVKQAASYCSWLYVTSDVLNNPWDTLPAYFSDIVAALDTVNTVDIILAANNSLITEQQTDKPVEVCLRALSGITGSDTRAVFTAIGNNRRKLYITDSLGVSCAIEIATWDVVNQVAILWVKVPSLAPGKNNDLYLTAGPDLADNPLSGDTGTAAANAVWSNGFRAVYHLAESGNTFIDSTGRGHTGTKVGAVSKADLGQLFSGGYITFPSHPDFSLPIPGSLMATAWFNHPNPAFSSPEYIRFLGKSESNQHEWFLEMYGSQNTARVNRISGYVHNAAGNDGAGDYSQEGVIAPNAWIFVADILECTSPTSGFVTLYRDNARHSGGPVTGSGRQFSEYGITYTPGSAPFTIGSGWPGNGDRWPGKIAEVRIQVKRSVGWISTDYYASSDSLFSYFVGGDNMKVFPAGAQKTATLPITFPAIGACQIEMFMSSDGGTTKATTSGKIAFNPTGAAQNVAFSIKMPAAGGIYKAFGEVSFGGAVVWGFYDVEDIAIPVGTVGPIVWA